MVLNDESCLICGTTHDLHVHHVFFGTANRRKSEKHGMKVYLCREHHTGNSGVHHNKQLDLEVKMWAQGKFEETHSRQHFINIFGKNYL